MAQCVATRTRREHNTRFFPTHRPGIDNFKIFAVFEHPILVDTRTMCKCVGSYNGLVGRNDNTHKAADQTACIYDFARFDIRIEVEIIPARLDGHDHFFKRGIARAFTQPINSAFDLTRAISECLESIDSRHAQIVVAVDTDNSLIDIGHFLTNIANNTTKLVGYCVAHGIGNIDRCRTRFNGSFNYIVEILRLCTRSIHWRKFHILAMRFGSCNRINSHLQNLIGRFANHGNMERRCPNKRVYARSWRVFQGFTCTVNIFENCARQTANNRAFDLVCNTPHSIVVLIGRYGKSGLDNIDIEPRELMGNFNFFAQRERSPWRLFRISQSSIKNNDAVFVFGV